MFSRFDLKKHITFWESYCIQIQSISTDRKSIIEVYLTPIFSISELLRNTTANKPEN